MAIYKYKYFSLPNIFTMLNLISGSIAVYYAFEHPKNLIYSSILIGISLIFDFLDGFTARLFHSTSDLGKQLDSLADLISFGLAPATIVFQLIKVSLRVKQFSFDLPIVDVLILLSPLLILISAALRLAKYNIDTRQSDSFIGLPTPAAAIFFASIPLLIDFKLEDLFIVSNAFDIEHLPVFVYGIIIGLKFFVFESIYFYIPIIFIFSFLMIIELPMFSLKFRHLSFRANKMRYSFIGVSFLLILFFQSFSLPIIIILYIALSISQDITRYVKERNYR